MAVETKKIDTLVSLETHKRLKQIAKGNDRSIAAEVRRLIEQHVEREGAKAA